MFGQNRVDIVYLASADLCKDDQHGRSQADCVFGINLYRGKDVLWNLPALDTVIVSIVVGKGKEKENKMLMRTAWGYKGSRPANKNATPTLPREKDRHVRANSGGPANRKHISSLLADDVQDAPQKATCSPPRHFHHTPRLNVYIAATRRSIPDA